MLMGTESWQHRQQMDLGFFFTVGWGDSSSKERTIFGALPLASGACIYKEMAPSLPKCQISVALSKSGFVVLCAVYLTRNSA